MTRKRIQFLVSLLVTGFFLYLAFRPVPLKALWNTLRQIHFVWILPFLAITVVSMYCRTVRWKYLLEPVVNVPPHKLFPPLIICFGLNGLLPGRVGEFARAWLVARDHKVKFSSAFATVLVERIADGIGLLTLFVIILATVPLEGEVKVPWGDKTWTLTAEMLRSLTDRLLVACVVLLAGTILMLWGPFRRLVQAGIGRVPFLPGKIKEGIYHFIETFVQGFHSLRSPRIIFWVAFHTATVWLTVGWSLMIMANGFSDVSRMTLLQGMAVAIIICIAITIPAAPGYWGLYEVGCIFALMVLDLTPNTPDGYATALGFSLMIHAFQMVCTIGPALFFMWRRHVGLSEFTKADQQ